LARLPLLQRGIVYGTIPKPLEPPFCATRRYPILKGKTPARPADPLRSAHARGLRRKSRPGAYARPAEAPTAPRTPNLSQSARPRNPPPDPRSRPRSPFATSPSIITSFPHQEPQRNLQAHHQRTGGAALHSQYAPPSNKQTRNPIFTMPPHTQGTCTASPSIHRHRRAGLPADSPVTTYHLSQGPRFAKGEPWPPFRRLIPQKNPSALSSSYASGYQPEARTARHCLAAASAPDSSGLLLRPHSHSVAFESRG